MTVVGGGVIGLTVAYTLAREGHEVTVLEAETVGSGASRGNAGWFTTEFAHPELARRSIELLPTLPAEVDPDPFPHVDPLRYCEQLAEHLDVREHTRVTELPDGLTVIAAGIETPNLVDVELEGVKGYSVDVPLPPGARTRYLHEHKIALTAFPDRLRVAGFLERGAADTEPHPERIRELLELAEVQGEGDGWAGLRPFTPDGNPLIERRGNVIVATGHGMVGVTLAPLTGKVVAELVASRT